MQLLKTVPPVTTVTWLCICYTPSITEPPHLPRHSSARLLTGGNNPAELVSTQKEKNRVCLSRAPTVPAYLMSEFRICAFFVASWSKILHFSLFSPRKSQLNGNSDDNTCYLELKWKCFKVWQSCSAWTSWTTTKKIKDTDLEEKKREKTNCQN